MTQPTKRSVEDLAKLGIHMEVPPIEVLDPAAGIEVIPETDIATLGRSEAFMAERVKIRIATTTDINAPPYATLTVNDSSNRVQVPRGVVVPVKRMHVEVLARMRETRYIQPTRNPMDPEAGNHLIPSHSWAYAFEVVEDLNPRGRAWLETIMTEPTY